MEHEDNPTWNIEGISVQFMDLNFKPLHVHTYEIPSSMELQSLKEITNLGDTLHQ
jgi:hypothetical protein